MPDSHPMIPEVAAPPGQIRAVLAIASLYLFRMLGLFMVLPVLMLYGDDYTGSTPLLLGLALGAYGFSQAVLQIPFGLWSDRWGRRPVVAVGLALFALGSIIAALSDSVYGLIAGRFLQGSGAIAAALMALVGDSTSEANRSKAMAAIGVSIGVSFSLALVIGPLITGWAGLSGVFWFTAALAACGFAILFLAVPKPPVSQCDLGQSDRSASLAMVIGHRQLQRLNLGVLILHLILMANFVAIPRLLENVAGIERSQHWWVYLPILVGAFAMMLPFMLIGEKRGRLKPVFLGALMMLIAVHVVLAWLWNNAAVLLTGLFAFFVAFNFLEATLPSLVTKTAPASLRGAASGLFSTSQFAGAFLGGLLGGTAMSWGGSAAVFALCAGAAAVWCFIAWPMAIAPSRATAAGPGESAALNRGHSNQRQAATPQRPGARQIESGELV